MNDKKSQILKAISGELEDEVAILGSTLVNRLYEGHPVDGPDDVNNLSLIEGIGLVGAAITILKETYEFAKHIRAKYGEKTGDYHAEISSVVAKAAINSDKFKALSKEDKDEVIRATKAAMEAIIDEL